MSTISAILDRLMVSALIVLLAGCAAGEHEDLRTWMNDQAKGMRGKVPPLPEIKPFPIMSYQSESKLSPFAPNKIVASEAAATISALDADRPRQPLESYPIEDLKITGIINDGKVNIAIVQTPPPNKPKRIRVGEYMGQSYGKVIAIDHCQVTIVETVKDANGAWTDREVVKTPHSGGQTCKPTAG
jgi:type IV pilus assembly protein PilP